MLAKNKGILMRLGEISYPIVLVFSFLSATLAILAGTGEASGSSTRQAQWLILLLVSLYFSWKYEERLVRTAFNNYAVLLYFAICTIFILSATWSVDAQLTVKRSILLLISTIFLYCMALAGENKHRFSIVEYIYYTFVLVCILSLLVGALIPSYGISDIGWKGVTGHKNQLGQIAGITVLMSVWMYLNCLQKKHLFFLLVGLLALVLSKSTTSMLVCFLATTVVTAKYGLMLLRKKNVQIWALIFTIIALLVVHFVIMFSVIDLSGDLRGQFFHLIGKSPTLTGRSELWELVKETKRFHSEWLGTGFGAFWAGIQSEAGYIQGRMGLGYLTSQSHNGYLDVSIEMGYIGLMVLFLVLALNIIYAVALIRRQQAEGILFLGFIVFILVLNYSESTFFRPTQFTHMLSTLFLFVASVKYHSKGV